MKRSNSEARHSAIGARSALESGEDSARERTAVAKKALEDIERTKEHVVRATEHALDALPGQPEAS